VRSLGDGVVGRGWDLSFLLTLPLWSVVSGELGREGRPWFAVVWQLGRCWRIWAVAVDMLVVGVDITESNGGHQNIEPRLACRRIDFIWLGFVLSLDGIRK
jgi:hypothetical protein